MHRLNVGPRLLSKSRKTSPVSDARPAVMQMLYASASWKSNIGQLIGKGSMQVKGVLQFPSPHLHILFFFFFLLLPCSKASNSLLPFIVTAPSALWLAQCCHRGPGKQPWAPCSLWQVCLESKQVYFISLAAEWRNMQERKWVYAAVGWHLMTPLPWQKTFSL